eukprot:1247706-Rhodomonas_salina.1
MTIATRVGTRVPRNSYPGVPGYPGYLGTMRANPQTTKSQWNNSPPPINFTGSRDFITSVIQYY